MTKEYGGEKKGAPEPLPNPPLKGGSPGARVLPLRGS